MISYQPYQPNYLYHGKLSPQASRRIATYNKLMKRLGDLGRGGKRDSRGNGVQGYDNVIYGTLNDVNGNENIMAGHQNAL